MHVLPLRLEAEVSDATGTREEVSDLEGTGRARGGGSNTNGQNLSKNTGLERDVDGPRGGEQSETNPQPVVPDRQVERRRRTPHPDMAI